MSKWELVVDESDSFAESVVCQGMNNLVSYLQMLSDNVLPALLLPVACMPRRLPFIYFCNSRTFCDVSVQKQAIVVSSRHSSSSNQ